MSSQVKLVLFALPFVALFAVFCRPNFIHNGHSPLNSCINNLRQLDGAKWTWAAEHRKATNDVPTWQDLKPYLRQRLVCPKGGTYTIGSVGATPTCSISGHVLPP